jgi:hypothetical protein
MLAESRYPAASQVTLRRGAMKGAKQKHVSLSKKFFSRWKLKITIAEEMRAKGWSPDGRRKGMK